MDWMNKQVKKISKEIQTFFSHFIVINNISMQMENPLNYSMDGMNLLGYLLNRRISYFKRLRSTAAAAMMKMDAISNKFASSKM